MSNLRPRASTLGGSPLLLPPEDEAKVDEEEMDEEVAVECSSSEGRVLEIVE